MIDEMNMRKLSPKTQQTYLRAVERLAKYLKHSPEQATSEQLRQFQIELVAQGASSGTISSEIADVVGEGKFFRQRDIAARGYFQYVDGCRHGWYLYDYEQH
jgi:site-specific recombinase XerD